VFNNPHHSALFHVLDAAQLTVHDDKKNFTKKIQAHQLPVIKRFAHYLDIREFFLFRTCWSCSAM
jgi:hypothetical protein